MSEIIQFARDPETGEVQAYKGDVMIGVMSTMGDMIDEGDNPEETGSVGGK